MCSANSKRPKSAWNERCEQDAHTLVAALDDAAEELRIRNLVSETPLSSHDYGEMRRAADVLGKARDAVRALLTELLAAREELLSHVEAAQ